jgi:hypothetical protein
MHCVRFYISHFWDRPAPIFSDVRFAYLALVQDKKITCVLPANACCTVYVNCPVPQWRPFTHFPPRWSCLLRELTATIVTRSDTRSHNRLGLIQSLVPPHYAYNGYTSLQSVLLVENTGVPVENHRSAAFLSCVFLPTEMAWNFQG